MCLLHTQYIGEFILLTWACKIALGTVKPLLEWCHHTHHPPTHPSTLLSIHHPPTHPPSQSSTTHLIIHPPIYLSIYYIYSANPSHMWKDRPEPRSYITHTYTHEHEHAHTHGHARAHTHTHPYTHIYFTTGISFLHDM